MSKCNYDKARELEEQFAGRAAEIAAAFGHEWQLILRERDGNYPITYGTLRRTADSLELGISTNAYEGRINCRPNIPTSETGGIMALRDWGVTDHNASTPEATVAFERDAGQIARDFTRKVVAPYSEVYPKIVERKERRTNTAKQSQAIVDQLAAKLKSQAYPENACLQGRTASLRSDGCEITVTNYGTIDVKFSPSPEIALAFIDWLASQRKAS